MANIFREDLQVVFEQDPAARNALEVALTYAGLHAIWSHRIAHWLWKKRFYFFARSFSQISRFFTGIEIHPGAQIGRRFFIDHGMGVVIGETCEIGNNVTLFQGVTLGGTGKEKGKRHPTLEDEVMIATGAKVLGSIVIGKGSKVGANSVVLKDVPDLSTVVGIPGKVVRQNGLKVERNLNHGDMPDPTSDRLKQMETTIRELQNELAKINEKDRESNDSAGL